MQFYFIITLIIFNLFDHNVIFEIRLEDALDYGLLCPFHYYGITDLKGINDETYDKQDFNKLFSNERVEFYDLCRQSQMQGRHDM